MFGLVMVVRSAHADLGYYEGLITFQRQGDAVHKNFTGKGIFLVDLDSYVGTAIYIFPKEHRFQSVNVSFRHAILPIAAGTKTSTVLLNATDAAGLSDVYSYVVTGKNNQLAVSAARIAETPRVYKFTSSDLFYGGSNFYQFSGLLTFNSKKTLAANAQNQTQEDIANAIASALFDKGFLQLLP